jgi:nitrogen fixation protein FixH
MSYIQPIPPRGEPPLRSAWRFYPWAVVAALGLVVVVNVGMAWSALSTFPGTAVDDTFDHSNGYDKVLAAAEREASLGWSLLVVLDAGRPVVTLTARDGTPLQGAQVAATAQRPVGPDQTTPLAFRAEAPGRYVAAAALTAPGQWDLLFSATAGERQFHATRRVIVP